LSWLDKNQSRWTRWTAESTRIQIEHDVNRKKEHAMVKNRSGAHRESATQVDAEGETTAALSAAVDASAANAVINAAGSVDESVRHRLIAEAAYFRAAHRGFAPGAELDDWLAAESDMGQGLGASTKP
jgi:hypothetical protein